jgi:hypothetical protein
MTAPRKLARMSTSEYWTEQDTEAEFEAERQGGEAFRNGDAVSSNPYPDRPLFEAWEEGWRTAAGVIR